MNIAFPDKPTETHGLPTGWTETTIGDLLNRDGGSVKTGPFGTTLKASEYSRDGVPIISVGEIGAGTLIVHKSTPMAPPEVVKRLPEYILKAGDIVFGRKGAVDRSGLVSDEQDGWFLGSDGIRLRPPKTVHPKYVSLQLQRSTVQKWLLANATGTTMASLNQEVLRRIPIVVPSIGEQRAIATALSDVDELIGALDKLIAKKRAIKLATMQQLLTGKTRLPGFERKSEYKSTEVGDIPSDWDVRQLGDLGRVVRGGSPRPAGDPRFFKGSFIPWLTVASLTNIPEHQLCVTETASFLTEEGSKRSRVLPPGTVIISNSGATLGVAKLLQLRCCANDGIAAIVDQRLGDKMFIAQYINTQTDRLREVVATGNGQPNLNTSLIGIIPVPFPPVDEQRAIASALSDMDAEITALEQRRDKTQAIKQGMMQELLTGRTRLVEPEGNDGDRWTNPRDVEKQAGK